MTFIITGTDSAGGGVSQTGCGCGGHEKSRRAYSSVGDNLPDTSKVNPHAGRTDRSTLLGEVVLIEGPN
jgi:hypothetical protein